MVGDWCWEVVPARGGGISALYPLRSYLVEIAPDQEGGISHFLYDPNENGQKVKLAYADPKKPPEKETAIFGRLGNPLDDLYGMSPLRAAKDDIVSEYYAVRYDQRFFRNSARPDLLVGIEGATEEEMQMNKEAWQQFKGADKAHRAAFMAGKPNVTLLSQNQRDVEYLEGRKLAREGECGAFGVPPILVGILDRATYSNLAESKVIFWGETMVPLLSYTASWVNAALVPFFPDVDFLEFDLDDIEALQENQTDKEDRALKRLASGAASIDETREALDEEPLGTPEAAQLYLPANLVPVASTEGEMQPEEPPAPELPPSNGMPAGIPTQEDIARMLLEGQPPPAPAQQP
jgi:HK97 family phage portal protein